MKIEKKRLKDELTRVVGENPIFYLKFTSQRTYAEDVSNGKLYMNTVQYYRELEEKMRIKGQGDRDELKQLLDIFNIQIIDKRTDNLFLSFPFGKATFEIDGDKDIFLFCLTGITIKDLEIIEYDDESADLQLPFPKDKIDNIRKDFGEHVVIINGPSFDNLINRKINGIEESALFGKVNYTEHNFIEKINAYNTFSAKRFLYKGIDFSYQKEFRLALQKEFVIDNYFSINSISDISHICTIDELIDYRINVSYDLCEIV